MRFTTSSALVWLMLVISFPAPSPGRASHENVRTAASVVNIAGFPVSISDASVNNMIVNSWLEFEASSRSSESVSELYFRVLIYDRNAKLVSSEDGVVTEPLLPGETRHYRALMACTVNEYEKSFVVVTKIKTTSGVWFVDTQDIGASLKNNQKGPLELQVPITHEFDLTLTAVDKNEILSSALKYLRSDPRSAKHLGQRTSLLLLRDKCEFASSKIPDAVVQLVTSEELQVMAEKERRIVFLRCKAFQVEGSRVAVHLLLNDLVSKNADKIRIPFRFNYRFICVKRDNRWVVERLAAHS